MTVIGKRTPTLAPRAARGVKRTMVGTLVAVVSLVAPSTAVEADQVGAVQAQVAGAEAQVAATGARLHQLTMAYDQANLRAANLAQQVDGDQLRLRQLQTQVDRTQATLRRAALLSYTGGRPDPTATGSGPADPSIRAEYLQVAAGDLTDVTDRYRTEQASLRQAERGLQAEESAAQAAAQAADHARQQALADAQSEQAQLDRLQSRLASLVATTAAARTAAPARQGLPVNNGLVAVVSHIVAPTTTDPSTTTTAPPAPAPTAAPATAPAGGVWLQLRECESGDNYQENTGNGFYGAYQFSQQTWSGLGYPGRPDLEPPSMQDQAAQRLQAQSGWGQWPACAAALGLT